MTRVSTPEVEEDVELIFRLLWGGDEFAEPPAGGRKHRAGLTYALFPRSHAVKALVPVWPPAVTAEVVRNYITPSTRAERIRGDVAVLAARLGAFTMWPHTARVSTAGNGLIGHLGDVLSREVIVGVFLGPRRVNRKPVLQVLTPQGGLIAYVKVAINDFTNRRVGNEAVALGTLSRLSLRTMTVPELLVDGNWHNNRFLVLAPVATQSDAEAQPERRRAAMAELSRTLGVELTPLAQAAWWREMVADLAGSTAPGAERLHALATRLAERCGHRPLELGAAHGDWSPWNMATVKGRVVVWDWERFRRGVPIGWDSMHFTAQSQKRPGKRVADELHRMIPEAASITHNCGSSVNDPLLVLTTYLLDLGQRYVADGQMTGVEPRGPIAEWLLEPLTELVRTVTSRSRP